MTPPDAHRLPSEAVDDRVEAWHKGAAPDKELHEFLGWTWGEYREWVQWGKLPEHEQEETDA